MSRFQNNVIPLLDELAKTNKRLIIVETGTIRNTKPEYSVGDGWSTLHLAKWNVGKKHLIHSIDLYTHVCNNFLTEKGLGDQIILLESSSLTALKIFDRIDLAYLDSANDADLILEEFKIVEHKISKGGIVVIDDVLMTSKEVVKGHKVVPYAKQKYNVTLKDRLAIIRGF